MPADESKASLEGLSARWRNATGTGPIDDRRGRLGPLVSEVRRHAAFRSILPRRLQGFPFTKPAWPGTVPYEPEPSDLGADYDTTWARRSGARAARTAINLAILRPLVSVMAKPDVDGLDRIAHLSGPVIFTPNHHSHVDTMLMLTAIPETFRKKTVVAAGADYFFDTRIKAAAAALVLGAIPIERRKVSRNSAYLAQALLEEGWSVVIFPEGGRSPDGWGQDWKPGAAFLALRAGVPVVPVHLEGTDRVFPKGARLPKRDTTTVTFGHPIEPQAGDDARRFGSRIEQAVTALADESRTDWWSARQRAATGRTPPLTGPPGVIGWRRSWARTTADKAREKPRRAWP